MKKILKLLTAHLPQYLACIIAVPYLGIFPSGKAISARFLFLAVYMIKNALEQLVQLKVLKITCSGVSVGPISSQS